ncbi:MAG: FimB/Mfa2 family fimbrial subunit [Prevotella sp.]|nr:FimB/Mfa2 family fimbrial subunit [Prevotella sp.]
MKKIVFFAAVLAVLGLTACEKTLDVGEDNASTGQVKNSVLQVRTRGTSGDEATVAYPVVVYVFQGDECKASQTIGDEGQTLNIALTEGTYSVYAVGGVSSSDYVLPTVSDALTTSAIALQEGKKLTDLMAASATVTLVDGGTNTVTLGMTRKTMQIQDVTIKKVPSTATAVTVTIAPLWQSLTIGGTYSTTNGNSTITLTKQEDGRTWRNSGSAYLLPPCSQPASMSVNITVDGTTKTYTYSTSNELEAGYKINIDGTYTEAVGVNLTGTITGATWLGERTISFTFDEDGSSTSGNDNNGGDNGGDTQDFPSEGDTYQGCYVLAVTVEDDGQSAEVVLLSPNERAVTSASDAESALASLGVDGISDWTVPTKAQMDAFAAARNDVTPAPAGWNYLYKNNNGNYCQYNLATGATGSANYITGINLRPVAIVSITKD